MNETHLVSEIMSQILPVEAKRISSYRGPACPVKSRRAIYPG